MESIAAGFAPFHWLEVASAFTIAAACLGIATALLRCARTEHESSRRALLASLLAFMTCSATLWFVTALGQYAELTRWLKVLTAAIGVATALLWWRNLPKLLTPSPREEPADMNALLVAVQQDSERFVASISHDLRGPLTTISSQAAMLEQSLGKDLTQEQRHRIARLQTGVRHMADIIEALLRLSRITRQPLHREPIDLSKLAEEILIERFRHEPTRRVEVHIEPDLFLCADQELMTIAFTQLLENAWKFTANTAGARIDVGHTQEDGRRVIFVRDNGAGFDMRYAKRLFQPFQRLHGKEFAGTGVGLAIVARAVERHEGRIWASAQPQGGATFYLSLPEVAPDSEIPKPIGGTIRNAWDSHHELHG